METELKIYLSLLHKNSIAFIIAVNMFFDKYSDF